jgi:hypothetical protein
MPPTVANYSRKQHATPCAEPESVCLGQIDLTRGWLNTVPIGIAKLWSLVKLINSVGFVAADTSGWILTKPGASS